MLDLNVALGRDQGGSPLAVADAQALCNLLDRYHIDQALVYHLAARQAHPADGNRLLVEEIAGHPRLLPCWVALPGGGDGWGDLAAFVRQAQAHGIRAVRLFPATFRFAATPAVLGPLCEQLEKVRLPVLIDWELTHWSQQPVDWEALDRLAACFPRLPLVLVGLTAGQIRSLLPILGRHPNLYLETSNWQLADGLAWLVGQIGRQRVLFGSGLPFAEASMPLCALARSSLSAEEQAALAGENACRLLALPRTRNLPRAGSCPLAIDLHAHLGKLTGTFSRFDEAEGLVQQMDRCGVERAAVVDLLACTGEDERGNRRVWEAIQRFPQRLLGYATVSPHHPSPERFLEECVDRWGFRGLKFHCDLHQCPLTSDRYTPHWEFAHARGLPILCHGSADRASLDRLLNRYSQALFLHAHVGAVYRPETGQESTSLAQSHANYYLDLAGSQHRRGALEDLVARVGADRVVFGSDAPLFDFAYQIGRVLGADLDEAQRYAILRGNALRLFRLGNEEEETRQWD